MTDPDDRVLFDALREAGASEKMAYTAVQEVRNMAGQNVLAAIDAMRVEMNGKIEQQGTRIDGKIEQQGTRIDGKIEQQGTRIDGKIEQQGTRIDGKIDEQGTRIDGKIDAQTAVNVSQRRMIWTLIGILCTAVLGGLTGLAALLYQMASNSR